MEVNVAGAADVTPTATAATVYGDVGNVVAVYCRLSGSEDTIRIRYNAAWQMAGVISPDPDGSGRLPRRRLR